MKLEEGESYDFQVLKRVNIADEGDFFMLRHKSGRRLLIPENYYSKYNIRVGSNIVCKVDKVSCTGKVYLEPQHPFYKEGEEYYFTNLDKVFHGEPDGNEEKLSILVKDIFNNPIKVLCNCNGDKQLNEILLRVERIKKGIPELICPCEIQLFDCKNLIGESINFSITGIRKNTRSEDEYTLVSENGYNSHLKLKHFKNYGFSIGDVINCIIYDCSSLGELKVEPEHPYYKTGIIYNFQIYRVVTEDLGENTVTVKDIYGNLCGLQVGLADLDKVKEKTQLECRVIGFRKGKPKLEPTKSI